MPALNSNVVQSDAAHVCEDKLQDLDHILLRRVASIWIGTEFSRTRCLLAVSGGADSVSLLLALKELSPDVSRLEVAHFNHGWRGKESDDDERFVGELCGQMEIPFHSAKSARSSSKSEASAREERYQFLEKTAYRIGARSVATAHTLNDRVETTLHNLFRGTGISGIRSIEPVRPLGEELILVRPMLKCSRSQVIDFLEDRQQAYRNDSSNKNTKFQRNFLRHQILPAVRERYGESVDERIGSFADLLGEHLEVIELRVRQFADSRDSLLRNASIGNEGDSVASTDSPALLIPKLAIINEPWPVVREFLVQCWRKTDWPLAKFSTQHWNQIRAAYESDSANGQTQLPDSQFDRDWRFVSNLPGGLTLESSSEWLRIRTSSPSSGDRT